MIFSFLAAIAVSQELQEKILTNANGDDRHPFWSPDGQKLIFESNRDGNWNIYLINTDGSSLELLVDHPADDRNPSWHPNGDIILFESNRDGSNELYLFSLKNKSTSKIDLHNFQYEPGMARFSPDGDEVIFTSVVDGKANFNLFIAEIRSGKVEQVTNDKTRSVYGSFVGAGDDIVFHSRRDTNNESDDIYLMNLASGKTNRLTTWKKHDFCPAVSPDGNKVVFARSMEESRPELFMLDRGRGSERRLTFNEDGDTQPSWSPDGTSIAFNGWRNGYYRICVLKIE